MGLPLSSPSSSSVHVPPFWHPSSEVDLVVPDPFSVIVVVFAARAGPASTNVAVSTTSTAVIIVVLRMRLLTPPSVWPKQQLQRFNLSLTYRHVPLKT
jgi:hypothetical protein